MTESRLAKASRNESETRVRYRQLCRTNGMVERMMQELTGLVRCLGITIQPCSEVRAIRHPAWAVRHAAWLLNRFQVKSSGKTAHSSSLYGRHCPGEIGLFGKTVLQVWWGTRRDGRKVSSATPNSQEELMLLELFAGMLHVDAGAATRSDGWSELQRAGSQR